MIKVLAPRSSPRQTGSPVTSSTENPSRAFALAHENVQRPGWSPAACSREYPADGFSLPYRFMVGFGTLLFAFLGLFVLRKVLLEYFSDAAVAMTLISIALASNYLEYSAIGGVLTHSHIFTLYSLILWQSIQFHKTYSYKNNSII